ncbi:acyltransferase family protein [Allosphingosinicella sp.]|jgi:peptidoglycan/LPS O-acetylase OafA/YrhL|uniref:acyltransferase family protein n=1 Tax=Allosphingosinicella sp. TaxID=2823234 RepID=UPI002EE07C1B
MRPPLSVISALQAGRAVAALAVVAHHAGQFSSDFVGAVPPGLGVVLERGYLGVDFFFVLSGFIIYHSNMGRDRTLAWSWRYLESRLIRIFVPYLPVGIALAAAYTMLPGLSASDRQWDWLSSLTLLPTHAEPALIVAWTLQHELVFYGLFLLFALSGRPIVAAALWVALIVATHSFMGEPAKPWFILIGLINVEFFFGMVAARVIATGGPPSWAFLTGTGIAGATYFALGAVPENRVLFGFAIALLLVPIVRMERAGRFTTPTSLVFLGDASYAVYLVHNPLMALLARVPPPHWALAMIWFAVAGTVAGLAYHLIWERGAIAFLRRHAAAWRRRATGEMEGAT